MNNDILIEKIKYLSNMPHSTLVEHCIYLENENDNYKAQKYITDFVSENGIICEKNKEIKRLNNIIDELEKYMNEERTNNGQIDEWTIMEIQMKLKELKGDKR